jgi:hypothetical protein
MTTMGRPNKGVGHVDKLDGDEYQKERLKTILETITGERSVQEACEALGIGRARFSELRSIALQSACDGLAPGKPGRPRTRDPERDAELEALRSERDRLRRERDTVWIRAELALAMPELLKAAEKGGAAPDRIVWRRRRR